MTGERFEDALRELQTSHDDAMEGAREDGYSDGYNDGSRDGTGKRDYFRDRLLEEISTRRLRAGLPYPLAGDTMTLDEVEKMIREAGE